MLSARYSVGISTLQNGRSENQDAGAVILWHRNGYRVFRTNWPLTTIILPQQPRIPVAAILCDGFYAQGKHSANAQVDLFIELLAMQEAASNSLLERYNLRCFSRAYLYHKGSTTALASTIDLENAVRQAYLGDTRGYLVSRKHVHLLTRDHNFQRTIVENEYKQDINDSGIVDFYDNPNQIEYIEKTSKMIPATNRLTKSISSLSSESLDTRLYEIPGSPLKIQAGSSLVMLTDGAYEAFRDNRSQLREIISSSNNAQHLSEKIVSLSEDFSQDNATAIVIRRSS